MIGFESRLTNEAHEKKGGGADLGHDDADVFIPGNEIYELYWRDTGAFVVEPQEREFRDLAYMAATICRRRIKPGDIVLISKLDEGHRGESGIAFTGNALYYWTEGDTFGFEVCYRDIREVDYDSNGVLLTVGGKSMINMLNAEAAFSISDEEKMDIPEKVIRTLPCVAQGELPSGKNNKLIIREMYNFIADILEYKG